MSAKRRGRGGGTIVIKREEAGEHAHHGGAWKVAYADFVTAMMAFFLLMWLLNATDEEKRRGLADYFSQANLLGRGTSGSGQPFGGRTPHDPSPMTAASGAPQLRTGPNVVLDIEEDDSNTPATPIVRRDGPLGEDEDAAARRTQATPDGALAGPAPAHAGPAARPSERPDPERLTDAEARRQGPNIAFLGGAQSAAGLPPAEQPNAERLTDAELHAEQTRREQAAFEQAAEQIRQAVAADPALADLGRQLMIEQVPEGLRIQLLDAERQPMFALGGAAPNDRSRALLARVAQVIQRLPNAISITGHTDATQFRGAGSNWDLSAERANATRRLLTEAGIAESRMRSVAGMADRDLLIADQPNAAANRRVSITLIRQAGERGR